MSNIVFEMKRGIRLTKEVLDSLYPMWNVMRADGKPVLIHCLNEYVTFDYDAILASEVTGEVVDEFTDVTVCQFLDRVFKKLADVILDNFKIVSIELDDSINQENENYKRESD